MRESERKRVNRLFDLTSKCQLSSSSLNMNMLSVCVCVCARVVSPETTTQETANRRKTVSLNFCLHSIQVNNTIFHSSLHSTET